MALKFKVAKIEDVEEVFRPMYVKMQDGTYQLEVSGAVGADKLEEFRNNNIQLLKDLEKYKDLNPEKYAELIEIQRKREEKELLDKGEVDKVLEQRTTAMRTEHEKQLKTVTESNAVMSRQLETLMIDNTVRAAALKNGIRPEAEQDVLLRAKSAFTIKDGKAVSLDPEGKVVYGTDGTTPLTVEEWTKSLQTAAPHLFIGSSGGGANNGAGGGAGLRTPGGKMTGVQKIAAGVKDSNYDS